jgi:prepilin-type N-terminal cleavage/methylation domain-containing protein
MKMKYQRPSHRAHGGFTLVEIVVTMGIAVMLLTIGIASITNVSHDRELQEPMAKLREFAKRARNQAILEQRPYQVEISPRMIIIRSMATAPGLASDNRGNGLTARAEVDRFEWEANVEMSVRRWNKKEFAEPGKQVWLFDRSGLCEPLAVEARSEYGYIRYKFNALDAHVEERDSEIK